MKGRERVDDIRKDQPRRVFVVRNEICERKNGACCMDQARKGEGKEQGGSYVWVIKKGLLGADVCMYVCMYV